MALGHDATTISRIDRAHGVSPSIRCRSRRSRGTPRTKAYASKSVRAVLPIAFFSRRRRCRSSRCAAAIGRFIARPSSAVCLMSARRSASSWRFETFRGAGTSAAPSTSSSSWSFLRRVESSIDSRPRDGGPRADVSGAGDLASRDRIRQAVTGRRTMTRRENLGLSTEDSFRCGIGQEARGARPGRRPAVRPTPFTMDLQVHAVPVGESSRYRASSVYTRGIWVLASTCGIRSINQTTARAGVAREEARCLRVVDREG